MEKGDGVPFAPDPQAARASTNVMDVWIQASLQVRGLGDEWWLWLLSSCLLMCGVGCVGKGCGGVCWAFTPCA
jgi:hypothetical protein